MYAGLGRQVWSGACDRLDARLLVVGDDRHRLIWLLFFAAVAAAFKIFTWR
jgi:hypothetical protein